MASTTFQDYNQNNPIVSDWLNDVNGVTYTPTGLKKTAIQSSAAWVRFSISGAVVTIQQSSNVLSVARTAVGVYVVTYGVRMVLAANCYEVSMAVAGFIVPSAETVNSVTLTCTNMANTAVDPTSVSLVVHGAN